MNTINMTKEQYFDTVRNMTDHVKKQITKRRDISDAHLDHIVPISFGYDNGISPEILSLPENLKYISKIKNLRKGTNLTEDSINILKSWIEQGKVDSKLSFYIKQEEEYKKVKNTYDFSSMYEQLKLGGMALIPNLPANIAYSFIPIFCQRRHDLRWEKTRKVLGHTPLKTHRVMHCAVYPDGRIERIDGNTRTYIFKNDLQFPDYEKPKDWFVIFYAVETAKEAEDLYHSIDSSEIAESFSEKVSGYLFNKNYHVNLPKQFEKGEKVYDIAVVAIDNYIPPQEQTTISIPRTSDLAEKARATVQSLDYFIQEFVTLGLLIDSDNIPKNLSSPLMGMLIRYLMVNKTKQCEDLVRTVISFAKTKQSVFQRPAHADLIDKNILIMLDELKTPEETEYARNHHVPYREITTRDVLPEYSTKTTANTGDRRVYCGWIAYCLDKCLAGESINEDIVLDITGVKLTDDTKTSVTKETKEKAKSILMSKYDDFWKTH